MHAMVLEEPELEVTKTDDFHLSEIDTNKKCHEGLC